MPSRSFRSRAGSPPPRSRSASTRASSSRPRPTMRSPGPPARRRSTPAGSRRPTRWPTTSAGRSCSSSRRSSTSSSSARSTPPTRCSTTRAGARSSRSSRGSWSRARPPGSCCPASRATTPPEPALAPAARFQGVTASLPPDVQQVFTRFVTPEYTTIDPKGQPITWPVTPYYREGAGAIDVTTAIGYPKKARDAQRNPHVALLFSDPTGCGLEDPPMVLVQGTAHVDDRDLEANRERYARESVAKLPATRGQQPPAPLQRFFGWYYTRLYINVRPERVYVWPRRAPAAEPQLLDSHMEEVRSGHDEEPDVPHARPVGGAPTWDERMEELGSRYPTAVLALAAPDGFPFATRVPVRPESAAARVRIDAEAVGVPIQPGL